MFAQFGAKFAAVGSACRRYRRFNIVTAAALVAAAGLLAACAPATIPLSGADPADPAAKVARVGDRSTIAPYSSLRPSTPTPWRERNDSVAPQPRPESAR